MDSLGGDKSLEQGRRELNGLAVCTTGQNMTDRAPVIIEISVRRDVKCKFVVVHGMAAEKALPKEWI
jgi:hypothetical protein